MELRKEMSVVRGTYRQHVS